MKHKYKITIHTFEDGDNINIIAKLDFFNLLKFLISKRNLDVAKKNVTLSMLNVIPKNSETEKTKIKTRPLEKRMMKELGAVRVEGTPVVCTLLTLRSNVRKVSKYIYSNICNNGKGIGGLQGGKGKTEVDADDLFHEHKGAKKALKGIKNWGKAKSEKPQKIKIKNRKKKKVIGKWNSADFLEYMKEKFKEAYGVDSFELNNADNGIVNMKTAKGRAYAIIKHQLLDVFKKAGYSNEHLKMYIDWVYETKAGKLRNPITLAFVRSQSLITEWITSVTGKVNQSKGKRQKLRG